MKRRIVWILPVLITGLFIFGCSPRSKYERLLKRELASGVKNDSLFMGIYLGMDKKEFYIHCWNLNRSGLIMQGTQNMTVKYEIKEELRYLATMNFYPEFFHDSIYEMPVRFIYNGWSPWDKKLSSDSLQLDVLSWYKKIYGNDFIKVEHPERGIAYVKVDGNRRITIYKENDMHVWAVFTDMEVKMNLLDSLSDAGIIPGDITKIPEKE